MPQRRGCRYERRLIPRPRLHSGKGRKGAQGKEKNDARPQLPARPMVTKDEAAAILLVSPAISSIRKKLGLKWKMVGRETHYYLKEIVDAIHATQCPWTAWHTRKH